MKQSTFILMLCVCITSCAHQPSPQYDLLIKNANIIDGSGGDAYMGDIAINADSIVKIGNLGETTATLIINARGRAVSPGFIDLHSHAERDVLKRPDAENNIRQGVTTILGGNCGGSPGDVEHFFTTLEKNGAALNVGLLIGHNTVRRQVMQRENRHATAQEMQAMQSLVDTAMQDGAYGLSSGLIYIPGNFAPPAELQKLATVAHQYGGFYASHMRSESSGVLQAVQETIDVGAAVGVPIHISHHKTSGLSAWGLSVKTLEMIDIHRAAGMDITLDQYPYTASNTNLGVLFPQWSLAGGQKAFIQRMQDPQIQQKIRDEVIRIMAEQRSGTELWRIQISSYSGDPSLEGKTFEQVLQQRELELTMENAAQLAIELQLNGGGRGIYHTMQQEDVERIMRHPATSVASDGRGVEWQKGSPHPRNYGTYPRVLAFYTREKGVLTLPEAVRKMTSLPASRMNLNDRGLLAKDYKADIVIWDPAKIQDNATYVDPHRYSTGIDFVIVNGIPVVIEGVMTGVRPGHALKNKILRKKKI
jgi:N-acyl-D-amino-acid deacylase